MAMRFLRQATRGLRLALGLGAAGLVLGPGHAHAGNCDYKVVSAGWHPHPSPDSIYVDVAFDVSVDFPVSSDPQNPSEFAMDVAIRFNGVPLDPMHEVNYAWWQREADCVEPCNPDVCEIKAWLYKGTTITDRSRCARNAQNVCGCPPLGTPVVHHKPVPKPPGNGMIEIEIIPLNLVSCNPITPQNDILRFPYPGTAIVPGLGTRGVFLLALVLGVIGLGVVRRQRPQHPSATP